METYSQPNVIDLSTVHMYVCSNSVIDVALNVNLVNINNKVKFYTKQRTYTGRQVTDKENRVKKRDMW